MSVEVNVSLRVGAGYRRGIASLHCQPKSLLKKSGGPGVFREVCRSSPKFIAEGEGRRPPNTKGLDGYGGEDKVSRSGQLGVFRAFACLRVGRRGACCGRGHTEV